MRIFLILAACAALGTAAQGATLTSVANVTIADPFSYTKNTTQGSTALLDDELATYFANPAALETDEHTVWALGNGSYARGEFSILGAARLSREATAVRTAGTIQIAASFVADRDARVVFDMRYHGNWARTETRAGTANFTYDLVVSGAGRSWATGADFIDDRRSASIFSERRRLSHSVVAGQTYDLLLTMRAAQIGGQGYSAGDFAAYGKFGFGATNGAKIAFDDPRMFSSAPPAPAPLPPAAPLLAAGCLALAAIRRRRDGGAGRPGTRSQHAR